MRTIGERPFRLDFPRPSIPFKDYAHNELRYRALAQTDPKAAEALLAQAQQVVTEKYRQYEELANRRGECFHPAGQNIRLLSCGSGPGLPPLILRGKIEVRRPRGRPHQGQR